MSNLLQNFLLDNFMPPKGDSGSLNSKPRIKFIDLAKGICIILVVMVHSDVDCYLPNFQALRMPLYFVLSGLFFRDYGGFSNLAERKLNKLLTPFVFFFILSFFLSWIGMTFLTDKGLSFSRLLDPLFSKGLVNGALWFLLCLFWCNLMYYFINRIRQNALRLCVIVMLAVVGFTLSDKGCMLPLYLNSSLVALPFFYFGVLLGKTDFLYPNKYDRLTLLFALLFLIGAYLLFYFFESPVITVSFVTWRGNLILAYANSCLMVMGVLLLCKMVSWAPVFSYMGRYSIIILVIHTPIVGYITYALRFVGLADNKWIPFGLTLLVCWLLIPVIRKHLPYVTAQKDWFAFSKFSRILPPPVLTNVNLILAPVSI